LFASAFAPVFAGLRPAEHAPRLGVVKGPGWATVDSGVRLMFETFLETLPATTTAVELSPEFDRALDVTFGLLNAHLARRFGSGPPETVRRYCRPLREGIEAGRSIGAAEFLALDAQADRLVELAARLFAGQDALITLSAPGEATRLAEGPGSGVMSTPWSLCGLPTVSLPLLTGDHGLPVGIQLIGAYGRDSELLRIAGWLENTTARYRAYGNGAEH
jgi:Asp-tRNA(Asn)/Glu-tRNA(Gln) amidotransferase A subunit family amidase